MKLVELVGGPHDGKRLEILDGVTEVLMVVPVEDVHMTVDGRVGTPTPFAPSMRYARYTFRNRSNPYLGSGSTVHWDYWFSFVGIEPSDT